MVIIGIIITILLIATLASFAGGGIKKNQLQRGMMGLGDVTTHTYNDIVAVLGNPNAISQVGAGVTFAQWMSGGYHVAMSFDDDGKCLGIDHEVVV